MSIEQRLDKLERLTLLAAKEAFNMDDVAAYTGFKKSYIYKLVHLRQIPHYKGEHGGKCTFFAKSEIDKWLLAHRVATQDELEAQAAGYVLRHPAKAKGGAK